MQTMVMQPVRRDGEVLTYVAGISGFDQARLGELNQTRRALVALHVLRYPHMCFMSVL